jgi:hypothetical protein
MTDETTVGVTQAARELGLTPPEVLEHIRANRLVAVRDADTGLMRVPVAALDEFIARQRDEARDPGPPVVHSNSIRWADLPDSTSTPVPVHTVPPAHPPKAPAKTYVMSSRSRPPLPLADAIAAMRGGAEARSAPFDHVDEDSHLEPGEARPRDLSFFDPSSVETAPLPEMPPVAED